MRFHSYNVVFAAALLAGSTVVRSSAQSITPITTIAADHPSFAVATVKLHDPTSHHDGLEVTGDRFGMFDYSVAQLIVFAYSLSRRQIVNAPAWIDEERYDIDGRSDTQSKPTLAQQQEMIQQLLIDRFALKFHREQRDLPIYAVVVSKGGPKLKPAADPDGEPQEHSDGHGFETTQTYTSADIGYFIIVRQIFADRPLIDRTGLTGRYDFKLSYTYNETDSTPDPNAPPGLFTAMQQQLGLKLQPTKGPANVLVIDHVDRPSSN